MIFTPALAQTRPPVEAFARLPAYDQPRLSPDGKHLAIVQSLSGLPGVVIYTVGAPAGTRPGFVTSSDWIIDNIQWAKNDRLALIVKKSFEAPNDDKVRTWMRQLTVDVSGHDPVVLNNNQAALGNNVENAGIVDVDLDDPNRVFVPLARRTANALSPNYGDSDDLDFRLDLLAADVHTGKSHSFMSGSTNTIAWYMDGHGHVLARIDQTERPLQDHLKFYDGNDWHDAASSMRARTRVQASWDSPTTADRSHSSATTRRTWSRWSRCL